MPFYLKKSKGGFYVETKDTGRKHSLAPLPLAKAVKQMRALYYNVKK